MNSEPIKKKSDETQNDEKEEFMQEKTGQILLGSQPAKLI